MSKYAPITRDHHGTRFWHRSSNYIFAAQDAITALVAQELPRAMLHLPIGFIELNGTYSPVAVAGLVTGTNLFVAPDGTWLAGYIPAVHRGYPFALANTDSGQRVLCIDENSGLVSDTDGEAFFNEDGTPAQAVQEVLNFLTQISANHETTVQCCAALQKHGLIQPWSIQLQTEEGKRVIEGLYCIDEARLNALPGDALIELRDAGALVVAYCQLLSMQHLPALGKLAEAHKNAAQKAATPAELNLEFLNNSGTISFGNLQ